MTIARVDLDLLNTFILLDLGTIRLIPGLTIGDTEPSALPMSPYVMSSFELVASTKYRWSYNWFRFLRLGYILERASSYESGEFHIISKAVFTSSLDPNTYTIPNLFSSQMTMMTDTALGVEIGVMTDSLSVQTEPFFGISYKITNASPSAFPTLRMYIIKGLPLQEKTT